jgi:Pyridoxamine 5'-phosphate oxidase
MDALATPTAAPPVLYGAPAPPGELLPWSWAEQRLVAARNYWIATTRPDGRPHCRPVWGVWLADGFWFSTGSLARHNLAANPQITLHLESGDQVVIVEGVATAMTGAGRLQGFLAAYNPKYGWDATATDDQVTDSAGAAGPAYRVRPRVVFGWDADMRAPTRWSFPDPTTSLTP